MLGMTHTEIIHNILHSFYCEQSTLLLTDYRLHVEESRFLPKKKKIIFAKLRVNDLNLSQC